MDKHEKLLDQVSILYFRHERKEAAKKLFYLKQARDRTTESWSPDKWYLTPEKKPPALHRGHNIYPRNSYLQLDDFLRSHIIHGSYRDEI